MRRVLVIGGDSERAAGPFGGAIDLIESGVLQRHGIVEIGIAGYPEGHARLSHDTLMRALVAKIEAAELTGLRAGIVTQFSFDPCAILQWVRRLRDLGIDNPIRVGMTGPADHGTLLRAARRCGVPALGARPGAARRPDQASARCQRARSYRPDACRGARRRGTGLDLAAHFFSFGGAAANARWAAAAAAGRIILDRGDGFGVEP